MTATADSASRRPDVAETQPGLQAAVEGEHGPGGAGQAVGAGIIAALVGFTSSFAVVLAGL
ncbi:benzoate transporter, partial [Nocardia nova]|nr:benzoate transporter [Nocardia nova]